MILVILCYNYHMNILLTNDDGFDSVGIRLLKRKLEKYGTVVIVAPKTPMSAKSVSISIGKGLDAVKEEENIFSLTGTPADCVAFGLSSLNIDFDLVVSGCNHGLNISYDTVFSGTIGACIQALINKKPAVAFSADNNFDLVDKYFDDVVDYIIKYNLISNQYLLNVNFPLGEIVKDIRISREYYRKDTHFFAKEEDGYHAYRKLQSDFSDDKDSDCYHIHNGIVSIVPLGKTYFANDLYQEILAKTK